MWYMKKLLSFPSTYRQQQHLMKLNQLLMSFSAMALAFLCVDANIIFPDSALSRSRYDEEQRQKESTRKTFLNSDFSAHIFSNMIGIKL